MLHSAYTDLKARFSTQKYDWSAIWASVQALVCTQNKDANSRKEYKHGEKQKLKGIQTDKQKVVIT
jgi:hypothetical protein